MAMLTVLGCMVDKSVPRCGVGLSVSCPDFLHAAQAMLKTTTCTASETQLATVSSVEGDRHGKSHAGHAMRWHV